MVVDIASSVVTARDTRAGAWTLDFEKSLQMLGKSTGNTVSTDWVEVNPEWEPGDDDDHAAR